MAYGAMLVDEVQSSVVNAPPVFRDGNGDITGTLCRAWVNFDGSGAIRAAFNVSSVIRNSTGDYTINFSRTMPDSNFAVTQSALRELVAQRDDNANFQPNEYASGYVRGCTSFTDTLTDCRYVNVAIFR